VPPIHSAVPFRRARRIALWSLQGLLAAVFLAAAGAKLAGLPPMLETFEQIGFGQWFRLLTAAVEIVGAVALLTPRLAAFGGAWLAATMVFAVLAHLTVLNTSPAPAAVLVVLCLIWSGCAGNSSRACARGPPAPPCDDRGELCARNSSSLRDLGRRTRAQRRALGAPARRPRSRKGPFGGSDAALQAWNDALPEPQDSDGDNGRKSGRPHLQKLQAAGLVDVTRAFAGRQRRTYATLTAAGRSAYSAYLTELRVWLDL